jgi:hypothetical protein
MMGDDPTKSSSDLRAELQQYSCHSVPSNWRLPIRVVDTTLSNLPPLAQAVAEELTGKWHSSEVIGPLLVQEPY